MEMCFKFIRSFVKLYIQIFMYTFQIKNKLSQDKNKGLTGRESNSILLISKKKIESHIANETQNVAFKRFAILC